MEKTDKTQLLLECICLLREFGRKPFDIIDRILNLEPGYARKIHEKHYKAYQGWTKKYATDSLHRFYKDTITVLEIISRAAPGSVEMWEKLLTDPDSTQADRERAAKALLEWTKVYISSKEKAGVREMIPKAMLEAHDEAERLGGHLGKMLGSALDIDQKEPS